MKSILIDGKFKLKYYKVCALLCDPRIKQAKCTPETTRIDFLFFPQKNDDLATTTTNKPCSNYPNIIL